MAEAKAAAPGAEKPETTSEAKDKKPKATGAPRPRKHDYGITPEATLVKLVEEANVKRDIQKDWERISKDGKTTCAAYFEAGGSRHGLRVMSRRKLIKVVHADGTEYPKEYVKPEPKPPALDADGKPIAKPKKEKKTQAERLKGAPIGKK